MEGFFKKGVFVWKLSVYVYNELNFTNRILLVIFMKKALWKNIYD